MRIACYVNTLSGGGAERVLSVLANGLSHRGHKVWMVNDYLMDVNKTGNTFLAYPLKDAQVSPAIYTYGVQQNLDAKIDLSLGFTLDSTAIKANVDQLKELRELSADIWAQYVACQSMTDFNDLVTTVKSTLSVSAAMINQTAPVHTGADGEPVDTCNQSCGSLKCIQNAWLKSKGIIKK